VKSIAIAATMISPPGSMGGNTKIALEFARSWAERGLDVCVFTTPEGERSFREYGVEGVRFRLVSSASILRNGLLAAHNRLWLEVRSLQLGDERFDAAYSACDFIPDLILGRRLRDAGLASRWIGCVYLLVPHPAFGYEGHYSRTLLGSIDVRLAVFYPYQRLAVLPAALAADGNMLATDVDAQEFVKRGYPRERLHAVYGIVNLDHISAHEGALLYDAVFVGRLHPQKGCEHLLRIWKLVLASLPGARLAIVGVGEPAYERRLRRLARTLGIEAAVEWLGFLEGPQKYAILQRSRVFLLTSVYDNCGMAAGEALACGLPAVTFDLPPLRVAYPRGTLRAPIGDEVVFARQTVLLLADEEQRRRLGAQGRQEVAAWDRRVREQEATLFIEKVLAMSRMRREPARARRDALKAT
jgi:glycosyltransferase involved in cell wall biosynthesis